MLSHLFFSVSAISGIAIVLISLASAITGKFQFWPPPGKDTWQHKSFLILFRGFLYPLIALTVVEFEVVESVRAIGQFVVGLIMLSAGFGLAFRITFGLGWRNAFGEKLGLRTTGWFAWSRNPIYVVTWLGLIGWGLIANSIGVSILLILWALLYLIAPLLEEPWLEREYGDAYRDYKKSVPRFIW